MSEGTTKPNGGREEMEVIYDDKEVEKRIEKFDMEVVNIIWQPSDKKLREGDVVGKGDKLNKAGDFVLAANPKRKELIAQEILEGNKAKAGTQVGHKKIDKKAKQNNNVQSKQDKNKPNTHTER